MMTSYLDKMFRYSAWANLRVLACLRASPKAQAEALPLLAHLLAAEHVWLSRLDQREPRFAVWPTLTLEECESLAAENEAGYRALAERLEEGQLDQALHFRTSSGQAMSCMIMDICTQVITHGPYHRGQIAKAVARAGGSAANTDFITYALSVQ